MVAITVAAKATTKNFETIVDVLELLLPVFTDDGGADMGTEEYSWVGTFVRIPFSGASHGWWRLITIPKSPVTPSEDRGQGYNTLCLKLYRTTTYRHQGDRRHYQANIDKHCWYRLHIEGCYMLLRRWISV